MAIEITCPHCGETTEWHNVCAILDICPKCLRPIEQGLKIIALEALLKAKETIKAFHGEEAWEIYDVHSPEMKKINNAIRALEQDAGRTGRGAESEEQGAKE